MSMISSVFNQFPGAISSGSADKTKKVTEKTVKNAISDNFVKQIQTLAREDAQKGIYMDTEFREMRRARMEQYVSPDRSGPMAQVNSIMRDLAKEQERIKILLERLMGNCSAKVQGDSIGQTAEIYSSDGEVIASYNSFGGGWTEVQTKAELKFKSETTMIYYQAYKEARTAMKAEGQIQTSSDTDTSKVDVLA